MDDGNGTFEGGCAPARRDCGRSQPAEQPREVVAVRRRRLLSLLLVAALLLSGGSALVGGAAAQGPEAPDCSTVGYSQDSNGNYEIESVRELQCIGQSQTGTTLSDDFVQVVNIDASQTTEWNARTGFTPIADGVGESFAGTFDGNGNEISGLRINRTSDDVGLFSVIGDEAGVTDVALVNVSVSGSETVGGVAGQNNGAILRASVSGAVAGQKRVGGITGENDGIIEQASAISEVGGESQVGGLVGENNGTVRSTYAAGPVAGLSETGGLVGLNTGLVEESYWDVSASGQNSSDGGTGLSTDEMRGSSATENMAAFDFENVWEVGSSDEYPQLRPPTGDEDATLSDYVAAAQEDKSVFETLTMVDFAIGGGSGIVMTIALYVLASRSRRGEDLLEDDATGDDSSGTVGDASEQTGAGTAQTPAARLDDQLDRLKRKIQAAKVPYEKEKYGRALDLCDEALFIAEDALDTAHAEVPGRVDDVEALQKKATSLRERVRKQWLEEQQTTSRDVDILDSSPSQTDTNPADSEESRVDIPPADSEESRVDSQPQPDDEPPVGEPAHSPEPAVDEDLIGDSDESEDIEWLDPDEESDDS